MAFTDHDHMVEELSADGSDQPFSYCIRARRPGWGPDSRDTEALELPIKVTAIAGVSAMDQVRRLTAQRSTRVPLAWSLWRFAAPPRASCRYLDAAKGRSESHREGGYQWSPQLDPREPNQFDAIVSAEVTVRPMRAGCVSHEGCPSPASRARSIACARSTTWSFPKTFER